MLQDCLKQFFVSQISFDEKNLKKLEIFQI